MRQPRVLAFSGSAREKSYNQYLVGCAARAAQDAGAEVTVINLRDFPLPIMDEDLERDDGQPEHAARLKALFADHDGLLLASPEYNSSISPLLKNAIDWVSRRTGDEAPLAAYRGKVAAVLSASPGRLGGLRGLVHLRAILTNLGVLVVPGQAAIGAAAAAFDEDGALVDAGNAKRVESVSQSLVAILEKLR